MSGGTGGRGTIFSVQTNGAGFTVLHSFSATDPLGGTNADGAAPVATLALSGGTLYGTAPGGGLAGNGTVYSLNTDGTGFTVLHSFTAIPPASGTNDDGAVPVAGVLALGNAVYGMTFRGGPGSAGTVFSVPLSAPPAIITNIVRNLDGTLTLFFLGNPHSTNIIQTTTSLMPPMVWQNISTNLADAAGAWQFTDGNTASAARFYRSYAR